MQQGVRYNIGDADERPWGSWRVVDAGDGFAVSHPACKMTAFFLGQCVRKSIEKKEPVLVLLALTCDFLHGAEHSLVASSCLFYHAAKSLFLLGNLLRPNQSLFFERE